MKIEESYRSRRSSNLEVLSEIPAHTQLYREARVELERELAQDPPTHQLEMSSSCLSDGYLTDDISSIVSITVTVSASVLAMESKVKLSLYRDRHNARTMDGSSTTSNSPS